MKRLQMIAMLAGIFSSAASHAESYTCQAKANPSRGFRSAFSISINSTTAGGKIVMNAQSKRKVLGVISEAGTLDAADPAQKEAFEATLGMISEEDVSGVSSKDLSLVKKLEVYRAEINGGDEVLVYRLFGAEAQLGGSIMISGTGTSCLP